ncbi:MAG: P-loop NTPase, partial [Bacteroidales bacterium]|nr:P-loop NTPase [Bacteroidales bacterium]
FVFGKNGGAKIAAEINAPLLGQIPLVMEVGEAAENGKSVYSQHNTAVIDAFEKIAERLI